jgi:alcohol dehydrogenase
VQALVFNGQELQVRSDYPVPSPGPGEVLLRVRAAGICATDLAILGGYKGWQGVLGHEFVADVVGAGVLVDPSWPGKRVVGEINAGCGTCALCRAGDPRQCPERTALGIFGRDGAFADYCLLPAQNLHVVPDGMADETAVFAEPTAAALEVLEQLHVAPAAAACVVGDGRLGCLMAQVLRLTGAETAIAGRRPERLAALARLGIRPAAPGRRYDLVVDCTGSPDGFATARSLVAPRGRLVLKSTYRGTVEADLSSLVVSEVTLVGSRCGPFAPALRLLEAGLVDTSWMVEATFPLREGPAAFQAARGRLKILLRP